MCKIAICTFLGRLLEPIYRVSQKKKTEKKKKNTQLLDGGDILRTREILKTYCPFLSSSWIYLYNDERIGMID